jgi:dienelactone hydrolase
MSLAEPNGPIEYVPTFASFDQMGSQMFSNMAKVSWLSRRLVLGAAALAICGSCGNAETALRSHDPVVRLWPAQAPGTEDWTGKEETADVELPNVGKVHIITNVTVPTLTVYSPATGTSNGTGIVVVPGGAFRALPWDLDGVETARWLTGQGVTAFVLKYRVRPPASGTAPDRSFDDFARRTIDARKIAIADAEQAMRLVRSQARKYGIAADRVGMVGFSAGAMAVVSVANSPDPAVRPNFAASLYGAYLDSSEPSADAAPLFIVAAANDPEAPPSRSVDLFTRWTHAKRPAELHLYEAGGHAFAFRAHHVPADNWPEAFRAWLMARNYLPTARH